MHSTGRRSADGLEKVEVHWPAKGGKGKGKGGKVWRCVLRPDKCSYWYNKLDLTIHWMNASGYVTYKYKKHIIYYAVLHGKFRMDTHWNANDVHVRCRKLQSVKRPRHTKEVTAMSLHPMKQDISQNATVNKWLLTDSRYCSPVWSGEFCVLSLHGV